jgi:hypothetical protein
MNNTDITVLLFVGILILMGIAEITDRLSQ